MSGGFWYDNAVERLRPWGMKPGNVLGQIRAVTNLPASNAGVDQLLRTLITEPLGATFPAFGLTTLSIIEFHLHGQIIRANNAGARTITIKLKSGGAAGSVLAAWLVNIPLNTASTDAWFLDALVEIITSGAGGTQRGAGRFSLNPAGGIALADDEAVAQTGASGGTVAINTNNAQTYDLTVNFSSAAIADSINITGGIVRLAQA